MDPFQCRKNFRQADLQSPGTLGREKHNHGITCAPALSLADKA